jgi:predicted permease
MSPLVYDVRMALRGFRRTRGFTATAVIILGIGIGMAVAMFTVFNAVLLRRLPVRDQDRIVVLWTHRDDPMLEVSGSFKQIEQQFRPESRMLSAIAAVSHWGAVPSPFLEGDGSLTLNRALVTGNYFDVLGARPAIGRLLRPEDEVAGTGLNMVISYGAWQRHFAGDSTIVGRQLRDAWGPTSFTIVGVAPPGLDYPVGVEAWTPPWSPLLTGYVIARLAPNASPVAARDEYFAIENRLLPDWHLVGATVSPFTKAVLGDVRPVLGVLTAAVGLLLLIACVNVGNLLLLRAAARAREIAVRRALGASYGDIVRQLVVESAALGVAGGALGLVWAQVLLRLIVTLAPAKIPRLDVVRLAGAPLGAAIGVTFLAVLLFGLLPALSAARSNIASPLRLDSRSGSESRLRRHVRQALVAAQIALALILLAGAGLLARSLERMLHLDLGYSPGHLAVLQFSWRTVTEPRLLPTGDVLEQRFRAIPGVTAVTPILIPPFLGANVFHGQVELEGESQQEKDNASSVPLELGGVDYFRTFGIPIVRGRGFLESDRENAATVAVVSAAIARRLWPNADPIGKRIHYWGPDSLAWRTVVGVAGDIRYRSLRDATPTIYLPWRQTKSWQLAFAVRTSGQLAPVVRAIRREARAVDPEINLWEAESMDDHLAGPLSQPRLSTFLLAAFGLVALLLAAIGLYGVMAAAVRDQTREIGVRMALGASPERVRREVLGRAVVVTSLGAVVGLAGALAGSRLLAALLFEVSPNDPVTLVGASLVLVAVGLMSAYVPARRATKIDPVQALRVE